MKNKVILLFLVIATFSTKTYSNCIDKKSAEKIQTISSWIGVIDRLIEFTALEGMKPKFSWEKRNFKFETFPKVNMTFRYKANQEINVHAPYFLSEVLNSAMENPESWFSIIANGIIDIEKEKKANNNLDRKTLYKYLAPAILLEKLGDTFVLNTTKKVLPSYRILRRILKVIALSAMHTLINLGKKEVFPEELQNGLPSEEDLFVSTLITYTIMETFSEILQRFIINDPAEQERKIEKEKFEEQLKEKLQNTGEKRAFNARPQNALNHFFSCLSV